MSSHKVVAALLLATNAVAVLSPAPAAHATTKEDVALNGIYRATSIGNWAKIKDQYNSEPTVVSTWTLHSSCSNFQECTGTLKSDQGWTAPMSMIDGQIWYARRDLPNWERCQDGTAYTGRQTYYFYQADPGGNGSYTLGSPVLAGKDKTVGPSGACGQNQWLTIEMPLRLDKIG